MAPSNGRERLRREEEASLELHIDGGSDTLSDDELVDGRQVTSTRRAGGRVSAFSPSGGESSAAEGAAAAAAAATPSLPRVIPPAEPSGGTAKAGLADGALLKDEKGSRSPSLEVPSELGDRGSISGESLAEKNKEAAKNAIRRGTQLAAEAAKKGYRRSKAFVIQEYVRFKNDPKRGPVILLYISVLSCVFLIPALFIDVITLALTLSVAEVLADIYGIAGCFLILAAEFARKSSKCGIRAILHYYFAFSEFCAGRGTIQLFVSSLCISVRNLLNLFKFVPGILLMVCGLLNVLYGMYAASKLNAMLAKMKYELDAEKKEAEDEDGGSEAEEAEDSEVESGRGDTTDGEGKRTKQRPSSSVAGEKDNLLSVSKRKKRKGSRRTSEFDGKTMTEKLDLLERKFEALNKRGDGRLTKADLKEGMKELNLDINAFELDAIFDGLDKNADGVVTKEEFEEWWFATKGPRFL